MWQTDIKTNLEGKSFDWKESTDARGSQGAGLLKYFKKVA